MLLPNNCIKSLRTIFSGGYNKFFHTNQAQYRFFDKGTKAKVSLTGRVFKKNLF